MARVFETKRNGDIGDDRFRRTQSTISTTTPGGRPWSAARNLVITRTSGGPYGTPSTGSSLATRTTSRSMVVEPTDPVDFSSGNYQLKTAAGVTEVKTSREQAKKDLQDLNDRFSSYLDKVRVLEDQNRKLADDLDKLKSKWGKETTQIKAMYQVELDENRQQLDDAEKEKARLEIKAASLEDQIEEARSKLLVAQQEVAANKEKARAQNQEISDNEYEVQQLRKELEMLENEHDKDRNTIDQLQTVLNQAREDLDNETLAHIDAENRGQTLHEEIEFLKSVHEQEMKELSALAHPETSPETRDFWKNELSQAVKEIQDLYEEKLGGLQDELNAGYDVKVQELKAGADRQALESNKFKDECKDLRNTIGDIRDKINDLDNKNNQLAREIEALRRAKEARQRQLELENEDLNNEANQLKNELDAVLLQLQLVLNGKLSLELEISAYRKLLESEENRYKKLNEQSPAEPRDTSSGPIAKRGEMSAKTTYQRSAKGPMTVADCPPDGLFVTLENTGVKTENLENWKIVRVVDNKEGPAYVLDNRFVTVKGGAKITIWGRGAKPSNAPKGDIECNERNWGVGAECLTKLISPFGEERASLAQKTVYS